MWLKKNLGKEYDLFIEDALKEKRIFDHYNINYLNEVDLSVCKYVIDNLFHIDVNNINIGNIINCYDLKEIALENVSKFGEDIYSEIEKLLFVTPLCDVDGDDPIQLSTVISHSVRKNGQVIEDSGEVSKILVPKNKYEIAGYFLGHELLHGLKDTNFSEYVDMKTFGEVIPIFYEFMVYSPEEVMKKELIKTRLKYIFDNCLEFSIIYDGFKMNDFIGEMSKKDKEYYRTKGAYQYLMCKIGCYLNSFYYALILYNMYKENPDKILGMISRVLMHEINTLEMLEQLGIYGDIRGSVFEKELQNVKKLVR